MSEITLNDISDEQFSAAELSVISALRSAYPNLDLRLGTVLRSLLVMPDAALAALNLARIDRLGASMSLKRLEDGGDVDQAVLSSVLANFNIIRSVGTKATGVVKVRVVDGRTYVLEPGFSFSTISGLTFSTVEKITARRDAVAGDGYVRLFDNNDGTYYFLVNVEASDIGSKYNIQSGTQLSATSYLYGFVSATANAAFSAGTDGETVENAKNRIPIELSHRGMSNKRAIEAQLRDRFDTTETPIVAVSVKGYGDSGMTRDRHNVFGVAVGGHVDVYVKTSEYPHVSCYVKTGTLSGTGTYELDDVESDGMYAVSGISDTAGAQIGSYEFEETRKIAVGAAAPLHDIDETANDHVRTKWQTSTIVVTGVPAATATRDFYVTVYDMPGISAIQDFVDSHDVKSVCSDVVVKSPALCLVSVSGKAYRAPGTKLDSATVERAVLDYVNSRGFNSVLTRSELAAVILSCGASRVDMTQGGLKLVGRVLGLDGKWYELSGDMLNIDDLPPESGVVSGTCVFAAEPGAIHIDSTVV